MLFSTGWHGPTGTKVSQEDDYSTNLKPSTSWLPKNSWSSLILGSLRLLPIIGTCNFMSPKAMEDQNTDEHKALPRPHIKISFKSDVRNLRCILYNFNYGEILLDHKLIEEIPSHSGSQSQDQLCSWVLFLATTVLLSMFLGNFLSQILTIMLPSRGFCIICIFRQKLSSFFI